MVILAKKLEKCHKMSHTFLESSTTSFSSSSGGGTEYVDDDEGNVIKGIVDWDELSGPSHLPTALQGLGTVERARWLEQQRIKEKEDSAKTREMRREALKASQERFNFAIHMFFNLLTILLVLFLS